MIKNITKVALKGIALAMGVAVIVMSTLKTLDVTTGFILFAVGGLALVTMQVGVLPLFRLAASAVEIFLQNFSTGVVISRFMSIATR